MSEGTRVDFSVLHGPSLIAPFAAEVAEFSPAFGSLPPELRRLLA